MKRYHRVAKLATLGALDGGEVQVLVVLMSLWLLRVQVLFWVLLLTVLLSVLVLVQDELQDREEAQGSS